MHRNQQAIIPEWPSQGLSSADCWDEKGFSEEQKHIQTQAPWLSFTFLRLPELNTLTKRRCITSPWIRRDNKMYSSPLTGTLWGQIRKKTRRLNFLQMRYMQEILSSELEKYESKSPSQNKWLVLYSPFSLVDTDCLTEGPVGLYVELKSET